MPVHPSAIISLKAELSEDIYVGPHVIIEHPVKIGRGTRIEANACIMGYTEIGEECHIHMGAILGGEPQDRSYKGGVSYLKIGNRNVIREYVTIHRGTKEDSSTIIGDDNLFMAQSHVAHNCKIGNGITMANCGIFGGYVEVGDMAYIGGGALIQQFTRLGKMTMISGWSGLSKDVPPFMLAHGNNTVVSLNFVGLKRAGIQTEALSKLKKAFRILYKSGLNTTQALELMEKEIVSPEIKELIEFIRSSKVGICRLRGERDVENIP